LTQPSAENRELWSEFHNWILRHSDDPWAFRGAGDVAFGLLPGIGRFGLDALTAAAHERKILELFAARAPAYESVSLHSVWDLVALAQHHGLPTRMLDWSRNPLVAAYFAVTGSPKPLAGLVQQFPKALATPERNAVDAQVIATLVAPGNVLDQGVGLAMPKTFRDAFDDLTGRGVSFLMPRSISPRIVAQGGLFSVHEDPLTPWERPTRNPGHSFVIPARARSYFESRLYSLGVEPQYLMSGLDGLCARLKWQIERRVGLGAIG